MSIVLNSTYLDSFLEYQDLQKIEEEVNKAHNLLHSDKYSSRMPCGWVNLPGAYDADELLKIKECAQKVIDSSDILIVIGVGGSYLGARAGLEFIKSRNYNFVCKRTPRIFFCGNNIDANNLLEVMDLCKDKDVSVNVISKSGTTLETALAFRVIKEFLEKKYGKMEAKNRIYCTTDRYKGNLRKIVDLEGYNSFSIPPNIGGRFSVLSPVGLFPLAVSGANIDEIVLGANTAQENYMKCSVYENETYKYAAIRNILYRKKKLIEILSVYNPNLAGLASWWRQLFGESEGKDGKGIFPSCAEFTQDLHSIGQFIQEGSKILFETSILVKRAKHDIKVVHSNNDFDNLNFLEGKTFSYINTKAFEGTVLAHTEGTVPNIVIETSDTSEYSFGELVYFFEKACAISGLILGVNPFNQPGVEKYKSKMFDLLSSTR